MKLKTPRSQADVRTNRVEVATHIRGLVDALKQIQREEAEKAKHDSTTTEAS